MIESRSQATSAAGGEYATTLTILKSAPIVMEWASSWGFENRTHARDRHEGCDGYTDAPGSPRRFPYDATGLAASLVLLL